MTSEADAAALELDASALRRVCRAEELGFTSTEELESLDGTFGQARASDAISFGLDATTVGYNIFATGPVGVGKRTTLELRLNDHARGRPTPGDWVYLHNFLEPRRPIAAAMPCGDGGRLAADMRAFLRDARRELAAAFDSEAYARRRREATDPLDRQQDAALSELRRHAAAADIALELTPTGVVTVPVRDGHPLTPAEFSQLSEPIRASFQLALADLAPRVESFLTSVRGLQSEARARLNALEREVGLFALGHLIDELKHRYAASPDVVRWLTQVADDVIGNLDQFRAPGGGSAEQSPEPFLRAFGMDGTHWMGRYDVNVFVAHTAETGAPVVIEMNPTYPNLFGRIEHQGVLGGGLATDHRMLRSGAIHRANRGYLMLPAAEVLAQPIVWLKLKEVLRTGRVRLENPADQYALLPTASLTPEEIDVDLKVVLVGSAALYELAYALDEDVRKLFRVKAEFDWRVRWDQAGERGYAAFVSSQARRNALRHFDAGAVAATIEHGGRLAESRDWLSTRFVEIAGLAAEASHWAAEDQSTTVRREHVNRAIEHKIQRSNLIEERLLEMVAEGTLMLDFDGQEVGQINGLSVLDLGDYAFGRPVRITATAGPGRGDLMSIERETELSGHIHDKGFLTLAGYLRKQYGTDERVALTATVTFEQSYERIDGDSAASAELYALLSQIARMPLRQDIAVTGSVNQRGELQAIGGVNEKIEGFYRACALGGLTGRQGVIIPEANERHLMLASDVVESVRAGRFHVWSAGNVDRGLAILTASSVGERDDRGQFPPETLHARIKQRLVQWRHIAGAEAESGRRHGVFADE